MELVERYTNIVLRESTDDRHLFVISDDSIDSHGTRFRMTGWSLDYYAKNALVTYGHPNVNDSDHTLVIGKGEVFMDNGKLMSYVEYDLDSERARDIKRRVEKKLLNMASIRANVFDGEMVDVDGKRVFEFTNQVLLDWGIVMHGSNLNALAKRATDFEQIFWKKTDNQIDEARRNEARRIIEFHKNKLNVQ